MSYVPLHCHCRIGSVRDSILDIAEYVSKAKAFGISAVALTDHGQLTGIYQLYNECKKQGVKPVIGCEVYAVREFQTEEGKKEREYNHLILLVHTQEGLGNLLKIHNSSQLEYFYYRPLVPHKLLEQYGKGLIGLSACVSGEIPEALLADDEEKAKETAEFYAGCLDSFYLELQPGNFPEQHKVNRGLVQLSAKTRLPLVVTNDIHYLNAEDAELHDWVVKLGHEHKGSEIDVNAPMVYPDTCYYLMPETELKAIFPYDDVVTPAVVNSALENTTLIAASCECEMDTAYKFPHFPVTGDLDEHQALAKLCYERLLDVQDSLSDPARYSTRLQHELSVIRQLDFSGYFLMVEDFIAYARKNNIAVGPGRGSAGGALVSNLLGISPADPLKYNLLFERFLSPDRPGMPDVDVDYGSSRRSELKTYAAQKYGPECCAQVGTLGIRHARAAVKDAGRLLQMAPQEVNAVTKLIPKVLYDENGDKEDEITLANSLDLVPDLAAMRDRYPQLFDIALKLEKIPNNSGVHAAGLIIAPFDITDKIPLVRSDLPNVNATSLGMADCEHNGWLKFDFLALATIEVIEKTMRDVGYIFDYRNNGFDDATVWDIIGSNKTTGLFQLGSHTYKERLPRIKPHSIEQLAACLALLRGPCISSGADKVYMDIAEGKKQVELIHPVYDEVTKGTNGIMLYQEQLMKVAMNVGFSSEESYRIMKCIAKKKVNELRNYKEQFTDKAKVKGLSDGQIERIFSIFVSSGQYSFNTAHAVSYALLAYASAYMKVHYPLQYLTNLFTNAYCRGQENLYQDILDDCRRFNIEFLPPDVNNSDWEFKVEDGKIRIGLCAVKTLGESCWQALKDKRPFASFDDFLERINRQKYNAGRIQTSILSGLFDWCIDNDNVHDFGNRYDILEVFYQSYGGKKDMPGEIKIGNARLPLTADEKDFEQAFFSIPFFCDETVNLPPDGFDSTAVGDNLRFEAVVRGVTYSVTRKKTRMARIVLGTRSGTLNAVAFDAFINNYEKQLKTNRRLLLSVRKESAGSCILRDVC